MAEPGSKHIRAKGKVPDSQVRPGQSRHCLGPVRITGRISDADARWGAAIVGGHRVRSICAEMARPVGSEEVASFLGRMRKEEAGHLMRLQSLLHGREANRQGTGRRQGDGRRSASSGSLL